MTFSTIDILIKKQGSDSVELVPFTDASILISGDFMIVSTEIYDGNKTQISRPFELRQIQSYKTTHKSNVPIKSTTSL